MQNTVKLSRKYSILEVSYLIFFEVREPDFQSEKKMAETWCKIKMCMPY
jgi:hypothetical protein